ncbi:MAG: hypothetical protein KGK08_11305 [Acidobacteriota bacterium]|nr:hypothetical protein [Acidobacteriota bacterium]
MNLLRFLARAFIDVFGITPPPPEKQDRMAWVIAGMLVGVLLVMAAALVLVFHYLHS